MTLELPKDSPTSGDLIRKPIGWQLWRHCDPRILPHGFQKDVEEEDGIVYKFTPGYHLADLMLLRTRLHEMVWSRNLDFPRSDPAKYVKYVRGIWGEFELDDWARAACVVHGDCTLENLVWERGHGLRIIDPGDPRGMLVQELDEAKLLQSFCTHWEVWRRGWPIIETPVEHFRNLDTRLHLQLLLSHWLRLSRHYPSFYAEFVIHECKQLLNLHRPRWDPYRFSQRCASFLLYGN
jgi:hypothetical protein